MRKPPFTETNDDNAQAAENPKVNSVQRDGGWEKAQSTDPPELHQAGLIVTKGT